MAFPAVRIRTAAHTDAGQQPHNEDTFIADASMGLCAVADGMGRQQQAGEIASRTVMAALAHAVAGAPDAAFMSEPSLANRQRLLGWIVQTVAGINLTLYAQAQQDPALTGMGTTLDLALVRGHSVFLAHVGNSRAYVLREGALYALTDDHTLGNALIARGAATPEEAAAHPQRNVLVRSMGIYPDVHADVAFYDLAQGDVFLLSTVGLHGLVPPEHLRDVLAAHPTEAPAELVRRALDAGGHDNITAVVFVVEDSSFNLSPIIGSEVARNALVRARLFENFTVGELLRVQRVAVPRELSPGMLLLEQGTIPKAFYLVIEGHLTVWFDGQPIGRVDANDTCGEYALVDEPSSSTLRVETPTRLLEFPSEDIKALMASDAHLAAKFGFAAMARFTSRVRGLAAALARYRKAERASG